MRPIDADSVFGYLVEEGQDHASKYGFRLGDTIKFSPSQVAEIIEKMPTIKVPRWIPVTERLPEDIKPVIVTWKNTDPKSYYQYVVGKRFIGTAYYKNGRWFWYSSVTEDLLAEYGRCDAEEFDEAIEVIAWQDLPEPWKGGAE